MQTHANGNNRTLSTSAVRYERLWTASMYFYIVASLTFLHGNLVPISSLSLYIFLGVSVLCILKLKNATLSLNLQACIIILYAFIMFIGMAYTKTANHVAMGILYDYVTMVILAICLLSYLLTTQKVKSVIMAYTLASFSLCIYVFSLYGSELVAILSTDNIVRIGSRLSNTNEIGWYSAYGAILSVYQLLDRPRGLLRRLFFLVEIAACSTLTLLSGSKTALFIILFGVLMLYVLSAFTERSSAKKLGYIVLGLGAVVTVLYLVNTLPMFNGIKQRMDIYLSYQSGETAGRESELGRSYMIEEGLRVFSNYPILGEGTAASAYHFGSYSHNNYVELLMNSGIVGFVLYYIPYVVLLATGTKKIWYKCEDKKVIVAVVMCCTIMVCGISVVSYYSRYYQLIMMLLYYIVCNEKTEFRRGY